MTMRPGLTLVGVVAAVVLVITRPSLVIGLAVLGVIVAVGVAAELRR